MHHSLNCWSHKSHHIRFRITTNLLFFDNCLHFSICYNTTFCRKTVPYKCTLEDSVRGKRALMMLCIAGTGIIERGWHFYFVNLLIDVSSVSILIRTRSIIHSLSTHLELWSEWSGCTTIGCCIQNAVTTNSLTRLLAAMSSSRSDVVTLCVRSSVHS